MSEKLDANDVAREQGPEGLARQLDQKLEETPSIRGEDAAPNAPRGTQALKPSYKSASQLISEYPDLRPPIVTGLLRRAETMNIIAQAKVGKSWLSLDLALAVVAGLLWLGVFATVKGRVLILDNELHGETISSRLPLVAKARGITIPPYSEADEAEGGGFGLYVETLRGRLVDIFALESYFRCIPPGTFSLVILDAFYRFLPKDTDENDNGTMAAIYNQLDAYALQQGCAFVAIHHCSKGPQGGKSIVDVGAGAGAQARATDTHLILRPHKEEGVVVMEAAARSWPRLPPLPLRWTFPVWNADNEIDPAQAQGAPRDRLRDRRNGDASSPANGAKAPAPKQDAAWFAKEFGSETPEPKGAILDKAIGYALSMNRAENLFKFALDTGKLHRRVPGANQPHLFATVPQDRTPEMTFDKAASEGRGER